MRRLEVTRALVGVLWLCAGLSIAGHVIPMDAGQPLKTGERPDDRAELDAIARQLAAALPR